MQDEIRMIQTESARNIGVLRNQLWGLIGLMVAAMGGVIAVLVEVHK